MDLNSKLSTVFGHRTFESVRAQNNFWSELATAEGNTLSKKLQASNNGGILYRNSSRVEEGATTATPFQFVYTGSGGDAKNISSSNGTWTHENISFSNLDRFRWFKTGINDDAFSGLAIRMMDKRNGMIDLTNADPTIVLKAFGGLGNDHIKGGARGDSIQGGAGNDVLEGMAGDDAIWGDAGDDVLDGGVGKDRLVGGEGADTFMINSADGDDVVDFKRTEDKLIVDGVAIDFDNLPEGFTIEGNQLKKGNTVLLTFT